MKRLLIAGLTTLTLGFGIGYLTTLDNAQTPTLAKNGADDPAGDQRRGRGADDGIGHASIGGKITLAKNGADDPAGDQRRGRGADDGINHASVGGNLMLAKNGADDPAGDDRGGHGPGHA